MNNKRKMKKKILCLSHYAYVFSSTKSVTRAEWDLHETEKGRMGRVGKGGRVTNDPNNVCT
jgi:hypothetical protein